MKLLSEELMHELSRAALAVMVDEKGGVVRFAKAEPVINTALTVMVDGNTVEFRIASSDSN